MDLYKIGISNFRIFGLQNDEKEFDDFEIRPLTFFVGPNSAGKSSFIKALKLLKVNFNDSLFSGLDFEMDNDHNLGDFKNVLKFKDKPLKFRFVFKEYTKEYNLEFSYIENNKIVELESLVLTLSSKNNGEADETLTLSKAPIIRFEFKTNESIIKDNIFLIPINIIVENNDNEIETIFNFLFPDDPEKKIEADDVTADNKEDKYKDTITNSLTYLLNENKKEDGIKLYLYSTGNSFKFFFNYKINDIDKNLLNNFNRQTYDVSIISYLNNKLKKNINIIDYVNRNEYFEEISEFYNKKFDYIIYIFDELIDKCFKTIKHKFQVANFIEAVRAFSQRIISNDSNLYLSDTIFQFHKFILKHQHNNKRFINEYSKTIDFINKWITEFTNKRFKRLDIIDIQSGYKEINFVDDYDNKINITDCGFGFTPLIPIILSVALTGYKVLTDKNNYIMIIEEPETHLHPNLQSKLAEFFIDAFKTFEVIEKESYNLHFIVETHNEYMIRKLPVILMNEKKIYDEYLQEGKKYEYLKSEKIGIYNINTINPIIESEYSNFIKIEDNGTFSGQFNIGFTDEIDRIIKNYYELFR